MGGILGCPEVGPATALARDGNRSQAGLRAQAGFWTKPVRMQRVQTLIRLTLPPWSTLTLWRLGCHIRVLFLLEWLTLWPYWIAL